MPPPESTRPVLAMERRGFTRSTIKRGDTRSQESAYLYTMHYARRWRSPETRDARKWLSDAIFTSIGWPEPLARDRHKTRCLSASLRGLPRTSHIVGRRFSSFAHASVPAKIMDAPWFQRSFCALPDR